MDSRAPTAIEFRSKLGFKQHNIMLRRGQSVLRSVMDAFEREDMQTQYSVLKKRIDLYFHKHKLAVEVDEKDRKDGNINKVIERRRQ